MRHVTRHFSRNLKGMPPRPCEKERCEGEEDESCDKCGRQAVSRQSWSERMRRIIKVDRSQTWREGNVRARGGGEVQRVNSGARTWPFVSASPCRPRFAAVFHPTTSHLGPLQIHLWEPCSGELTGLARGSAAVSAPPSPGWGAQGELARRGRFRGENY